MDFYILDEDFKAIAIVDTYKSYIWAERYAEDGDCELYLPASTELLDLLRIDRYIVRRDSQMVCQIKTITLTTDTDNGDYLAVVGYDVKRWLNQRIIWGTENCDGKVEDFIRHLVSTTLGAEADAERQIQINGNAVFLLGESAGLTEAATEQVSYANIAEKVQEYCQTYGWGYRVYLDDSGQYEVLRFEVYKGEDRSDSVIFSDDFENIATSSYEVDATNIGNVALVAGAGEGAARRRVTAGEATGIDRYEVYSDSRDESDKVHYEDITAMYPTGSVVSDGGKYVYKVSTLDIAILNADHQRWLQENYPSGTVVTVDGSSYYRLTDQVIAEVPSASPEDNDECTMGDVVYQSWLMADGYEALAEYGEVISFNGTIEPHTTFEYGVDYFLGDIVTVENHYGISKAVRITEVVEAEDENGYTCEPSYEYLQGRD